MQIRAIGIHGYKGVETFVTWEPAVVLFGRNDAGKSNILEAIAWAGGLQASRADPLREDREANVFALVELDRLDDEESLDAKLLAALLQMRHVPPLFPYEDPHAPAPDPEREAYRWGPSPLSEYPGSLLEWDPSAEEDAAARQFKIGCVGEMYLSEEPLIAPGSITEVRRVLRDGGLAFAGSSLEEVAEDAAAARAWFEVLLDRCLRSRWIWCQWPAGVVRWLSPMTVECSSDERAAARRLADVFGDEHIPILDGFVRGLASGQGVAGLAPFLAIHGHVFRPWRVVRVSGSTERLERLSAEVAEFVRSDVQRSLRGGRTADPWLADHKQGATVISEPVRELCQRLSEHATAIAPLFVTRAYDIRVEPLEPVQWHRHGDRRIRLALVRSGSNDSFDLAVAGSGLAVWAAFAVEEAMREVAHEPDQELREIDEDIERRSDEDGHWAPRHEPEIGEPGRLYVLDEPERHLHPEAQEQAARWLASRIDEQTSFLLATHALPFLSLPAHEVEYALVSRGEDGLTRAKPMTDDVWGFLDERIADAGVGSRAQLIQLARAFLVVEGAHDESVIRHFYRERLARERIVVLPIRGAKKAKSLIETELLARFDAPLIFLFDEVRAKEVVASARPSRKDISVYALWEMLQDWPPERKRPHVVDFALPDIYCAVPDQCVRQVVADRGGSFPGWEPVIEDFAGDTSGLGFKTFFLRASGLPSETETTALLGEILERCRMEPRAELRRAIDEVVDRARAETGAAEVPS